MNYKFKSLIYLFAFIISALLYYQMEQEAKPAKQSAELTLEQDLPDQEAAPVL